MSRYQEYKEKVRKEIDRTKALPLAEGVKICKDNAIKKFDETISVCYNLKVKVNERVRGIVNLPNSFGADRKVLVFARGDKAQEAEKAGAAYVGDVDLIDKIKKGWFDFDVAIATPDMMKEVGKLGAQLGRRGLMPNPKVGTVTMNLAEAVSSFKAGRKEFRSEKNGVLQVPVGKKTLDDDKIIQNIGVMTDTLNKLKPSDVKGEFVQSVFISSAMGPGIRVSLS